MLVSLLYACVLFVNYCMCMFVCNVVNYLLYYIRMCVLYHSGKEERVWPNVRV